MLSTMAIPDGEEREDICKALANSTGLPEKDVSLVIDALCRLADDANKRSEERAKEKLSGEYTLFLRVTLKQPYDEHAAAKRFNRALAPMLYDFFDVHALWWKLNIVPEATAIADRIATYIPELANAPLCLTSREDFAPDDSKGDRDEP